MSSTTLNEQAPAATQQPIGNWTITQAITPQGDVYAGKLRVEAWDEVYRMNWETTLGSYPGLAFLADGQLLAGWGEGVYSVMLYKINSDGSLSGRWISSAGEEETSQIYSETATGGSLKTLEGSYSVKGILTEDQTYEGILDICMLGETYQLTWYIGKTYYGVGLRLGDWLVATQCGGLNFGVMGYTLQADSLDGKWGLLGIADQGQERLTRA